jgi:glycosyltransferase involved in cell wall biosynthesis
MAFVAVVEGDSCASSATLAGALSRPIERDVLVVSVHPPGRLPSLRFRFEQYVPFLRQHGFRTTFSSVMRADEYDGFYREGRYARKAVMTGRGMLRRLADLLRASNYDLVVVQREAIQLGTALIERGFSRSPARLVFDFDDAIWVRDVSDANRRVAWLKRPGKTSKIIAMSDMVFAGNAYLRDYACRFNPNVKLMPTTIDTDYHVRRAQGPESSRLCVGWTGSTTTIRHFDLVVPVLRRLRARFGERVQFKVIGDGRYQNEELGVRGCDWSPHTEIEDLSEIDIGLMPLPDDEWSKGKCGLKALQFMALETPTVMSPVGVNTDIVEDGRNGFLATSEDEWFEKLSRLVESPELRERVGRAARATVIRDYSVESQKWRYLESLHELLG